MRYILVVDDEPRVATSTAEILAGLLDPAPDVLSASSYSEALALLRRPGLDALLTDHDLGRGASGLDLLAHARVLHPQAELVLMSGSVCPKLPRAAAQAGARTFLPKPFRPAELADALFGPSRAAPASEDADRDDAQTRARQR